MTSPAFPPTIGNAFGWITPTDITQVAIQNAINAALASGGGGVICLPPGSYNLGTTGMSFNVNSSPIGLTIHAHGVTFIYSGTGTAITFSLSGTGSQNALPTIGVFGLNVSITGAATGGIGFNNCTMGRASDCSVNTNGGSVVDAYIFQNTSSIWTEDFSMDRCYAGGNISNADIRFSVNGGTASFARFTLKDFQTGGGTYVMDIQSGSVYDATVDNIRGNFSGAAFIRIRNSAGAAMEGSWVRGIHTEPGSSSGSGIVMIDDNTCKVPVLLDEGDYFKGSGYIGPWITPALAAITPVSFYKSLNIHSPVLCDAQVSAPTHSIVGGPSKSILQTGTVAIPNNTTGTVTTTNAIWVNSAGAAGDLTIFATASGGAGGSIAKSTFAGEGATAANSAAVIESAARPGYYSLAITSVTVNTNGTVSFGWSWGGAGAPAITMTWTVVQEVMAI
jgi:hypothetical protein